MDILNEIITSAGKDLASNLFNYIFQFAKIDKNKTDIYRKNTVEKISEHLVWLNNWSKNIQYFGMPHSMDTDSDSIHLNLNLIPRKFRGKSKSCNLTGENDLIADPGHKLLLGDPGSGKTTTLKRISRSLLESIGETKDFRCPFVVRLRRIDSQIPLCVSLATIFGIPYETKLTEHKFPEKDIKGNYVYDQKADGSRGEKVYTTEVIKEYLLGDDNLENILPGILTKFNIILLLDGLDEVQQKNREKIIREIESISQKMLHGKIILSCRSGYFHNIKLEGFNALEICPLNQPQIKEFVEKWVEESSGFFSEVNDCVFRTIPAGDSGGSRPPIPIDSGHPFRGKPAIHSGRFRPPVLMSYS